MEPLGSTGKYGPQGAQQYVASGEWEGLEAILPATLAAILPQF